MKPLLKISGKSQRLGKKNSTQNYRTPKRKSIASRISLTIAVIIAGVMTLTSIVIYSFIYDGMVNRNKESMDVISNEVYENFNSMVSVQTNRISDLAIDGSVVDLLNGNGGKSTDTDELKKEINAKLKGASSDAKDTEHTFITDSKGRVICDSHEEYLNYDYSQNQCVILAQGGNLNMSTVHISPETGRSIITIVTPVKDSSGTVIGTLGKDLYTDYFSQSFDSFKFMGSGFIYIVGSDNQVIYHPDKLKINKKNSVKEIAQIISNKDNLSKKITGSINYNLDGKEYTGCYTSVPALKSLVVLSVEVNELKSEANTAGKIIIVSAVLMILIVVLLIYIVINRVFKPLKGLIKNTEEMSHGNLKVTSNIEENNEFGQLSSSFNKMSENIKSMILSLKKVVSELTFLSDTIKSSQDSTESSMKNIAVSSELISSDNMRMSEAVGNSSESFKRIVAKTEEIKTQSVMMTQKTNDIKKVNYRGLETVNTLKKVNFDTAQKLSVVNKSFKQLFENLSDINGIAGLVTSISKQTHILALNASIEAARAGEAGRGFNVVATQIKGLSLSISEQMSRIEELVRKIDANIMNTDEDLKEVNKSAGEEAKAVQETIENYNVVLKAAEEIISAISNVNNSINILDSENQNVNEVLNRVSSLSDEFSESLEEINTVIRSQYDNTRVMAELVERLEASTEDINSNMNKFTV